MSPRLEAVARRARRRCGRCSWSVARRSRGLNQKATRIARTTRPRRPRARQPGGAEQQHGPDEDREVAGRPGRRDLRGQPASSERGERDDARARERRRGRRARAPRRRRAARRARRPPPSSERPSPAAAPPSSVGRGRRARPAASARSAHGAPVCGAWKSRRRHPRQVEQRRRRRRPSSASRSSGAPVARPARQRRRARRPCRRRGTAPSCGCRRSAPAPTREDGQPRAPAAGRRRATKVAVATSREQGDERVHPRLLRVVGQERVERGQQRRDPGRALAEERARRPARRPGPSAARRPATARGCRASPLAEHAHPELAAAGSTAAASRPGAGRPGCRPADATRCRPRGPRRSRSGAWMACVRSASDSPTRKARTSSDFGRLTASRAVPSRAMRARGRATVGAVARSPAAPHDAPAAGDRERLARPPRRRCSRSREPGGCRLVVRDRRTTAGTCGGRRPARWPSARSSCAR